LSCRRAFFLKTGNAREGGREGGAEDKEKENGKTEKDQKGKRVWELMLKIKHQINNTNATKRKEKRFHMRAISSCPKH